MIEAVRIDLESHNEIEQVVFCVFGEAEFARYDGALSQDTVCVSLHRQGVGAGSGSLGTSMLPARRPADSLCRLTDGKDFDDPQCLTESGWARVV